MCMAVVVSAKCHPHAHRANMIPQLDAGIPILYLYYTYIILGYKLHVIIIYIIAIQGLE